MPKYVLHYFDFHGRALVIRLMFHQANVEFEDHRMQLGGEEFTKFKSNGKICPFGQLPILEVDGERFAQAHAIALFVADEFGLSGKTNLERAKTNMLIEGIRDIIGRLYPAVYQQPDEEKKNALKKSFLEEHLPKWLKIYEEQFVSEGGFFLGSTISYSDIAFFTIMQQLGEFYQKCLVDDFPKLKALYKGVEQAPNIKKYLESQEK